MTRAAAVAANPIALPSVAPRWRRPRAQHLAQEHDLAEMVRVVRGHVLDRIADGVPGERWVVDRRTDRSGGIAVAERGGTFQPSREARADGVPRSRRRRGPPERCAGRRRICRAVTSTAEPLLPEREVRNDFGMECGAAAMRRSASSLDNPSRAESAGMCAWLSTRRSRACMCQCTPAQRAELKQELRGADSGRSACRDPDRLRCATSDAGLNRCTP